jgi:creatinine amidohydrolase
MDGSSAWGDCAAPEVRAAASAGRVALWPIGATEQHGGHLATGFDLAAAVAVCERAMELAPERALLLPGLPLGASRHWLPLGATLALSAATMGRVVVDIAASVAAAGFGRLLIVNGHGGNEAPVLAGLDELGPEPAVEVISYWRLVDPERLAAACTVDGGRIGHAGEVETSIALHLGGLAREDRLPAPPGKRLGADGGARIPRPLEESPSGVYGDPSAADAELGRLVIEESAVALARCLVERTPDVTAPVPVNV